MDNRYYLLGDVSVPEERKEELTKHVLSLLYAGGIRKVDMLTIGDKTYRVASVPMIEDDGKIYFDYSIYERRQRNVSYYDTRTCILHTEDRGYQEYGVIMNLILVMIEAYSQTMCMVMNENTIYNVSGAAMLIESMIGVRPTFTNRGRVWQIMLFAQKYNISNELTFREFFRICPLDYTKWSVKQMIAILDVDWDIVKPTEYPEDRTKIFLQKNHDIYIYYVYELLLEYANTHGIELTEKLVKRIINSSLAERQKMSETEKSPLKELFRISLKEYPPIFVRAFSVLTNKMFWETWKDLNVNGYLDIEDEEWKGSSTESVEPLPTLSKIFGYVDEIKFLHLWGTKDLEISEKYKEHFAEWKEIYDGLSKSDVEAIDVISYFSYELWQMEEVWHCHLPDKTFVKEVLRHKEDVRYKKLIYILHEMMNEDAKFFPELTERQVQMWVRPYFRYGEQQELLTILMDAITNKKLRKNIFGL